MTRYAAEVSYDGGKFFGWQVQPGLPTVQLALENALSLINGSAVAVAARTPEDTHGRRSAPSTWRANGSRAASSLRSTDICRRASA